MYSTVHATVGVLVGEATLMASQGVIPFWLALTIASVLSFWSHTEVDRLGEANCYGTFDRAVWLDSGIMTGIIILSYYYLFGWTAVLFGYLALLIDIIDKFRDKIMNLPQVFPSHRSGFKMWIWLTKNETLFINISVTVAPALIALSKFFS